LSARFLTDLILKDAIARGYERTIRSPGNPLIYTYTIVLRARPQVQKRLLKSKGRTVHRAPRPMR
jgi:hypothetical protein